MWDLKLNLHSQTLMTQCKKPKKNSGWSVVALLFVGYSNIQMLHRVPFVLRDLEFQSRKYELGQLSWNSDWETQVRSLMPEFWEINLAMPGVKSRLKTLDYNNFALLPPVVCISALVAASVIVKCTVYLVMMLTRLTSTTTNVNRSEELWLTDLSLYYWKHEYKTHF